MKPERAAIKQAQAVQAVADSNGKIIEMLKTIDEKLDRLLAPPAQKSAVKAPREEKTA
jgi:hypothetical protein